MSRAATHLMISPTQIEYRADCLDEQTFRETQRFVTWLKQEVHFLALHWLEIMPQAIKGTAPRLKEPELLLRGEPDILGNTDLRFSISQEKAFEIIEGSNIYDDPLIFLRELLQNALDACKLQLWDDLCNGKYRTWIKEFNLQDIKPFHIKRKIYKNYRIQIFIDETDEDTIQIIVKDNGIGITKQAFQRICNVGISYGYGGDSAWKNTLNDMPLWLKPTTGFGIGLQSVFLATDKCEIYSKAQGECIHAVVESRKKDGYVQIRQCDKEMDNGTEVHICITKYTLGTSYHTFGYTYDYVHSKYDPITDNNQMYLYKVADAILSQYQSAFFPIEVNVEKKMIFRSKIYKWNNCIQEDSGYQYRWLTKHTKIQLWDKHHDALFIIELGNEYINYRNKLSFKGIELDNFTIIYNVRGCYYTVDFYGLDTKKYITLDRKKIKKEYIEEIEEIIAAAHQFFIDTIWKNLQKNTATDKFFSNNHAKNQMYAYSYWCQLSPERKDLFVNDFSANNPYFPCTKKRNKW